MLPSLSVLIVRAFVDKSERHELRGINLYQITGESGAARLASRSGKTGVYGYMGNVAPVPADCSWGLGQRLAAARSQCQRMRAASGLPLHGL